MLSHPFLQTEQEVTMISPFSLKVSPMGRLFLIGFEKDPDDIYVGFEPQWFDDPEYGTGLRVIAWREDGYVDVYQQPGLTVEDRIDVAGKGLRESKICPMPDAKFIVTPNGVDVYFKFEDLEGRPVEVRIHEKNPRKRRPFPLLAPVGSASENPSCLPVYFLFGFDFVRKSKTEVQIRIGTKSHRPDTFPFPMNGSRVYYMRYAEDTFLVDWCPARQGEIEPIGAGEKLSHIDIVDTEDGQALKQIRAAHMNHSFVATFEPPFLDLACQKSQAGTFVLSSDASVGEVRGRYASEAGPAGVVVTLEPNEGWLPRPDTFFLKFLFRTAKIFSQWPKTYRWTAKVKLTEAGKAYIESGWERI